MKMMHAERDIQSSGFGHARQFGMAVNSKTFDILIQKLYSNKQLAVLRELSSNAYDSHIAAGCEDVPFEVNLPTSLNPFLEVKDFGTGISNEDIYDVYTIIGESTKENTNSQTGALGLGSKTPFAVSDTFTVISRQNGVQNTYGAFLDATRIPSIVHISTSKTDESDGLTVQVPIAEKDRQTYHELVSKVYLPYGVKPRVTGTYGAISDLGEFKPWRETDQYIVEETRNYYDKSIVNVIQGTVIYPVSIENLKNKEFISFFEEFKGKVYIKGKIGDYDIQPSREELGYIDETIKNIERDLDNVITDLTAEDMAQLNKAENLYEACNVAYNLGRIWNYPHEKTFMWNAVPFTLQFTWHVPKIICKDKMIEPAFNFIQVKHGNIERKRLVGLGIESVNPKKTLFLYLDSTSRWNRKIAWHYEKGRFDKYSQIYIIEPNHNVIGGTGWDVIEKIKEWYMFDHVELMSELEQPPVEPRIKKEGNKPYTSLRLLQRDSKTNSDMWANIEDEDLSKDLTSDNLYMVARFRNKPVGVTVDELRVFSKDKIVISYQSNDTKSKELLAASGAVEVKGAIEDLKEYIKDHHLEIGFAHHLTTYSNNHSNIVKFSKKNNIQYTDTRISNAVKEVEEYTQYWDMLLLMSGILNVDSTIWYIDMLVEEFVDANPVINLLAYVATYTEGYEEGMKEIKKMLDKANNT